MAQKQLADFCKISEKHHTEKKTIAETPAPSQRTYEKLPRSFPPLAPRNLSNAYFVSATYDGQAEKAVIKLYEPESGQIFFWYDNTGHLPYCLTNLSPYELEKISRVVHHPSFVRFELVEKIDPLQDREIQVTKIITKDPLAIGGRPTGCIRDIIPEDFPKVAGVPIAPEEIKVWESKIKYYQSYIYDRQLLPGMLYEIKEGNLTSKSLGNVEKTVEQIKAVFTDASEEELEFAREWARLLEYPAPTFCRVALDIEVLAPIPTRVPDPREAEYPVICVSLYTSDGLKQVLLLEREEISKEIVHLPTGVESKYFDTEEKLIREVFTFLLNYPFVITFNGDDFDLRYLAHRAERLGIKGSEIPIEVGKRTCMLTYGVHIDLYKFFYNRSIQIYAFSNRYRDVTLDDVGRALLGTEKIRLEKSFSELTYTELAEYCFRDAEITFRLTSFDDELTMKLILVLSRISSMPMEDVSRQGVSRWIRNFMHREHRRRNMLIPNAEDILVKKGKTATKAIIKGKKYKGAIVVEPVAGVHFNVAVMDFPSLYPSIIKVWNL
ncbi:MAG: 3'-5' exonuclease, partial [Candidatus Bathyarchaeota archaeon]|nr:3'-5' exonuclease [Candidatus Bathyarchaeota archaeon]